MSEALAVQAAEPLTDGEALPVLLAQQVGLERLEPRPVSEDVLEHVAHLLTHLDETERVVLEKLFGLTGQAPEPMDRVAEALALSPRQVTALYQRALTRLRTLPLAGEGEIGRN